MVLNNLLVVLTPLVLVLTPLVLALDLVLALLLMLALLLVGVPQLLEPKYKYAHRQPHTKVCIAFIFNVFWTMHALDVLLLPVSVSCFGPEQPIGPACSCP